MMLNICHFPQFPAEYPTFRYSLLQNCYMASILKIGSSWRAQVRRKGHKETGTFPTKAAAQEWARKVESEIDAKKRQAIHGITGHSIATLIEQYQKERPDLGRTTINVLSHLKQGLGNIVIEELTAKDVTNYVKQRGYAPATAQVEMSVLGTLIKVASVAWKYHVPKVMDDARESLKIMGKVKKSRQRDRRPTAAELKKLCAWFDKKSTLPMRDLIWFSIYTAMRASEVTGLRWDDLDRKHKTILIRDRKDPQEKIGNNQTVPLLAEAIEIIDRQPKDGEFIFPYRAKTFSSIFPRACVALGIEDLRWHDLRHEGASRLFEKGYQIHEVALFTGHKDWAMLKRYTQLRAKDLRRL